MWRLGRGCKPRSRLDRLGSEGQSWLYKRVSTAANAVVFVCVGCLVDPLYGLFYLDCIGDLGGASLHATHQVLGHDSTGRARKFTGHHLDRDEQQHESCRCAEEIGPELHH